MAFSVLFSSCEDVRWLAFVALYFIVWLSLMGEIEFCLRILFEVLELGVGWLAGSWCKSIGKDVCMLNGSLLHHYTLNGTKLLSIRLRDSLKYSELQSISD